MGARPRQQSKDTTPASESNKGLLIGAIGGAAALVLFTCLCGGIGGWWFLFRGDPDGGPARPGLGAAPVIPATGPGSKAEPVTVAILETHKPGDVRIITGTLEVKRKGHTTATAKEPGQVDNHHRIVHFRAKVKTQEVGGPFGEQRAVIFVERFEATTNGKPEVILKPGAVLVKRRHGNIWATREADGTGSPFKGDTNEITPFLGTRNPEREELPELALPQNRSVGDTWDISSLHGRGKATFAAVTKDKDKTLLEVTGRIENKSRPENIPGEDNLTLRLHDKVPLGGGRPIYRWTQVDTDSHFVLPDDRGGPGVTTKSTSTRTLTREMEYLKNEGTNFDSDPWGAWLTDGKTTRGGRDIRFEVAYNTAGRVNPNHYFGVYAVVPSLPNKPMILDKVMKGSEINEKDWRVIWGADGDVRMAKEATCDFVMRTGPDANKVAQGKEVARLKGIAMPKIDPDDFRYASLTMKLTNIKVERLYLTKSVFKLQASVSYEITAGEVRPFTTFHCKVIITPGPKHATDFNVAFLRADQMKGKTGEFKSTQTEMLGNLGTVGRVEVHQFPDPQMKPIIVDNVPVMNVFRK